MTDENETQAISEAIESRELLLAAALQMCKRVIDHVDAHDVAHVTVEETIPAGSFEWHVRAHYAKDEAFVGVEAHPHQGGPWMVTPDELAEIMGNAQAAFAANLPRAWVELAVRASEEVPCS